MIHCWNTGRRLEIHHHMSESEGMSSEDIRGHSLSPDPIPHPKLNLYSTHVKYVLLQNAVKHTVKSCAKTP